MTNSEIETKFKVLETELALLKQKVQEIEKPKEAWWNNIPNVFNNNPAYEEAMRLGREYRLAQREEEISDDNS